MHQNSIPLGYNIFKTDDSIMPELLEKYSQASLYYRDEEFTQQAEMFITKIASDKKIPKELKAKFPLYQILISICKIFMLSEYEIVVFACVLDHCNWKIEEVVFPEEENGLVEFPSNMGLEISNECKKFIMYLLVITFSLKQYLNEKQEVEKIQAYCEKICKNFQIIFNRWTRLSSINKFNYSAPEINRKFKFLAKKDYNENMSSLKDYNIIVDNIMTLTGTYNNAKKPEPATTPKGNNQPTHHPTHHEQPMPQKSPIFHELHAPSFPLAREDSFNPGFDGLVRIPSVINSLSRQPSLNFFPTGGSFVKRQPTNLDEDDGDKLNKKVKPDQKDLMQPVNLLRGDSTSKLVDLSHLNSLMKDQGDDLLNLALPMLSKKDSAISQTDLEAPSFSRFNSNLSFLYDK